MGKINKCSVCKEYAFLDNHKCKPIFYFKHEDWGEEFQAIRADSFHDAAKAFAEKYNTEGDYSLMNKTVEVIISDGKEKKTFIVGAEPDIYYTAETKEREV